MTTSTDAPQKGAGAPSFGSSTGLARTAATSKGMATFQVALSGAAMIAMPIAMWAALIYAGDAVNLAGDEMYAQRIFYLHMGCNIATLVAFSISLISSASYLVTRRLDWDRLAHASVEIGLLLGIGIIVTGAIWAKPTWNTYWTWDPRLTTSTITVLIYFAYLLFRNGIDNRETRARFASIYALVAFLTLPLTYYSARWFRSIHPVVFNGSNPEAEGSFGVGPTMATTIMIAAIAFTLMAGALLLARFRQLRVEDRIEEVREELY